MGDIGKIRSRKDLSDRLIHITQDLSTLQTIVQSGFISPTFACLNRPAICLCEGGIGSHSSPAGGACKTGVPRSRLLEVHANVAIRLKGQCKFLTRKALTT